MSSETTWLLLAVSDYSSCFKSYICKELKFLTHTRKTVPALNIKGEGKPQLILHLGINSEQVLSLTPGLFLAGQRGLVCHPTGRWKGPRSGVGVLEQG